MADPNAIPTVLLGGDPFQNVRHGRRFPFAPTRRRDPTTVQGGGDLAERLGAGGLSLGNDRRDGGGERVGPGRADGVDGGAGLGEARISRAPVREL
jgi:hypothetical protein